MLIHIQHETVYRYAETVRYTIQALRLTPHTEGRQHVLSWTLETPGRRIEQIDAHGNVVHYLTVEEPHRELRLAVTGMVETDEIEGHPGGSSRLSPLAYRAPTTLTAVDEAMQAFARDTFSGDTGEPRALLRAAETVAGRVAYRPGVTQVTDPAILAFERGEGVCQDQAHVYIACCRALQIPARYASGYLHTTADTAVASHAWVEVWLAGRQQWYGLDITHGRPVGASHCRLAVGRDYLDAAPVRGVRRGGGAEQMQVTVHVADAAQQ